MHILVELLLVVPGASVGVIKVLEEFCLASVWGNTVEPVVSLLACQEREVYVPIVRDLIYTVRFGTLFGLEICLHIGLDRLELEDQIMIAFVYQID